jgi:D-hexose-6-phosphate mutarotase
MFSLLCCVSILLGVSCRGGVPLIFPQYGRSSGIVAYANAALPTVPADGFLNRLHWSVVESAIAPNYAADPAPTVSLTTMATPETYEMWPYFFEAMYTVSSDGDS